jgi:hypothetical protein
MKGNEWPRTKAETSIREVLDALKAAGSQKVIEGDGDFEIVFHPRKQSLDELFSKPGPIITGDHEI